MADPAEVERAALARIQQARDALAPEQEGLGRLIHLGDLDPTTAAQVQDANRATGKRIGLLDAAIKALTELLADGYPVLPLIRMKPAEYADLTDEVRTLETAFARFAAEDPAVALGLTAGAPEPKS